METVVLAERLSALDVGEGGGCGPEVLAELVAMTQRLQTVIAVETAGCDATGALTADGYRSPAGFLAGAGGRLVRGTARRYLACGRILGQFPLLAAAAGAGEVTFDHVAVFARLLPASASDHRRACLVRDEAELVAAAKSESATVFSGRCVSWRQLVDTDVPVDERLGREEHGMTVNELDARSSELTLRASTEEIEQVRSAINQLADRAWRAEGCTSHESEAAELGRDGEPEVVEESSVDGDVDEPDDGGAGPCTKRRHPRRGRLQAQAAAELAARALSGETSGMARPVVVVVMDWATFTTEAERYATGTAGPVDVFDPSFRSETIDGHPVPPDQGFLLALRGEVQRCVIDADSLKVDLGRQQRLFNAAGRRAVQVRDRTCVHPACDLPATWADIDHIVDWQAQGPTDTTNAQALCRHHHVQKHQRPETGPNDDGGTVAA